MPLIKPKPKKIKKEKVVEPFWQELIGFFFAWWKFHYNNSTPPFDTSAPRALKAIVTTLREKCEAKGHVWEKDLAKRMLLTFLDFSLQNENVARCNRNYFLASVNKNKQTIIDDIRDSKLHNRG